MKRWVTFILVWATLFAWCAGVDAAPKKTRKFYSRALISAALKDDIFKAHELLAMGANPNTRVRYDIESIDPRNGLTPLIATIQNGRDDALANVLLDEGADPNLPGVDVIHTMDGSLVTTGYTPLMAAAHGAHYDLVRALVSHGARINVADSRGGTALMEAAQGGDIHSVRFLIEKGANVRAVRKDGRTVVASAAVTGQTEVIRYLLSKGAMVNTRETDGYTPLHWAVNGGFTDTVALLIKAGANCSAADASGYTPLHLAASGNYTDIVTLLFRRGVNVNARTKTGETAAYGVSVEMLKLLFDHGADPNLYAFDGTPALVRAASMHNPEIVQLLLEHGANVNARDRDGYTALMYTAAHGRPDMVKMLLDRKADTEIMDRKRLTALLLAVREGQPSTAKLLIDAGANVNHRATPEHGAAPVTATSIAWDRGHFALGELLKKAGAK